MKRRYLALVLLLIAAAAAFALTRPKENRPFADLSAGEIERASVRLLPPDATFELTTAEIDELARTLRRVVIYERDEPAGTSNGQGVIYTLTLRDGTERTVVAYNPFLMVDGVWYRTKYAPCEALNALGNRIGKTGR